MKELPHALNAEQSVLGSILINPEGLKDIQLTKDDFFDSRNREIYSTIKYIESKNIPIDLVTISTKLKQDSKLDLCGGNVYLSKLLEITPTSSNIVAYAKIVSDSSVLRSIIDIGGKITSIGYRDGIDINSVIEESSTIVKSISDLISGEMHHDSMEDIITNRFNEICYFNTHKDELRKETLFTGFNGLDSTLGGLKGGDLCVIAGRPGMGKTLAALNIVNNIANSKGYNKKVMFFSLEMTKEQLVDRIISMYSGVNAFKFRTGNFSDTDMTRIGGVIEELSSMNMVIQSGSIGYLDVRTRILEAIANQEEVGVIVIDYLQIMNRPGNGKFGSVQEITDLTKNLKKIAIEFNVPIILLSQLSRAVDNRIDKKPVLSDLRDSGSIEQDADQVLFCYREEYYNKKDSFDILAGETDIFEFIVSKNRHGAIGTVKLGINLQQQKIFNLK